MLWAFSVCHSRDEWKKCGKKVRPLDLGDGEPESVQYYRQSALVVEYGADDSRTGTDRRNSVGSQGNHSLSAESHCYVRARDLQRRRGVVAAGWSRGAVWKQD